MKKYEGRTHENISLKGYKKQPLKMQLYTRTFVCTKTKKRHCGLFKKYIAIVLKISLARDPNSSTVFYLFFIIFRSYFSCPKLNCKIKHIWFGIFGQKLANPATVRWVRNTDFIMTLGSCIFTEVSIVGTTT